MQVFEFQEKRPLGEVLNIPFRFLREEFFRLGKVLLYIVGPAGVVYGFFNVGMLSSLLDMGSFDVESDPSLAGASIGIFFLSYMGVLVLAITTWVLCLLTVHGYVHFYREKGSGNFGVNEVWGYCKEHFWLMVGSSLFFGVVLFISYMLLIFTMVFLVLIGSGNPVLVVLGAIFSFLGFIAVFGVIIYAIVAYLPVFSIQLFEKVSLFEAMKRSMKLIKGHFWQTFLMLLVCWLIMTGFNLILSSPSYFMIFMNELHGLIDQDLSWLQYPMMAGTLVGTTGGSLLYAVPILAIVFQYFHMVESKERRGLLGRIEALEEAGDEAADAPAG